MSRKIYLLLGTAFVQALAASSAMAQSADAPVAPTAAEPDEVVVVARKTRETLTSTPVAVAAFSEKTIDDKNIRSYQDLAKFAPGFNFQNQNVNRNDRGFQMFQSRGIPGGTTAFIDGVAVAGGTTGSVYDISQIEIINGPQSANFGRSTFGGAINFISARPKYDFGASADLTVATRSTQELRATIEGPIIRDILAAKVSGRYYHRGTIYDNYGVGGGLGEQESFQVTGSLLFEPTDNFTVYYRGSYWEDDDGSPAQARLDQRDYNCSSVGATALNYVCGPISSAPANRMVQFNNVGQNIVNWVTGKNNTPWILDEDFMDHFGLHREAQHHALLVDYDIPGVPLKLSGAFGYAKDDWVFVTDTSFQNGYTRPTPGTGVIPQPNPAYNNPANASAIGYADILPVYSRTAAGAQKQDATSAELRLGTTGSGPLQAMIGVNYLDASIQVQTNAFNNTGFANPGLDTITINKTFGIFGSLSYKFDFGLKIIAEGRIQSDEIHQIVNSTGGLNAKDTFHSKTPRVIMQYEPIPTLNFYGSYSEGVRPGTFNGSLFSRSQRVIDYIEARQAPGISTSVPEEKIRMWEAGVKARLFNRRLTLLAAAYTAKWTNRQVPQNVSYPGSALDDVTPPVAGETVIPPTSFVVTSSGGRAKLYGVELQASLKVGSYLALDGTYTYAETENQFQNCSVCNVLVGSTNLVGSRFGLYPAHSGSFSASYERPISDDWAGYARADYSYRGRIYADETALVWTVPSHNVDARIGVRTEKYGVELFGRNIFNNKVPSSLGRNTDAFNTTISGVVISPPDPPTFGLNFRAKY